MGQFGIGGRRRYEHGEHDGVLRGVQADARRTALAVLSRNEATLAERLNAARTLRLTESLPGDAEGVR